MENRQGISPLIRTNESYQLLRPRHLCFLRNPESDEIHGVDIRRTEEWEMTDGQNSYLSYLFVAYSALQFSHESDDDLNILHRIAETACRAAKLPAYWVACSCFQDATEIESDVRRGISHEISREVITNVNRYIEYPMLFVARTA